MLTKLQQSLRPYIVIRNVKSKQINVIFVCRQTMLSEDFFILQLTTPLPLCSIYINSRIALERISVWETK